MKQNLRNPKGLNTITVSTGRHTSFTENNNRQNSVIANCQREHWGINIYCQEMDGITNRELTEIQIKLPDCKTFTGTIQDLQSIPVILKNGLDALKYLASTYKEVDRDFTTKEIQDTVSELAHALSLFK